MLAPDRLRDQLKVPPMPETLSESEKAFWAELRSMGSEKRMITLVHNVALVARSAGFTEVMRGGSVSGPVVKLELDSSGIVFPAGSLADVATFT